MVQFLKREHVYEHPWARVTTAFWRKYPNPLSPHVIDIDVLNRHLDTESGCLHTTRLITCKGHVPDWIYKAVGGKNHCFVLERSVVDLKNQTLVMKSRNLSYENLIQVHETCTYDTHGLNEEGESINNSTTTTSDNTNNSGRTRFTQQAKIVVPIWGFSDKVENLTLDNFHKNAKKGLEAMENICQNLWAEAEAGVTNGIKEIRQFELKQNSSSSSSKQQSAASDTSL